MDDTFRPIEGYLGYRISRIGEVHSCWSRHARPALMTDAWLPMSPVVRHGYKYVNLVKAGKKRTFRIHRLVLEAFVGPPPEGTVACHGDGDRANNDLANLRWDTPKANSDDSLRHGTRAMGSRCNSKLTEADVLEIRRLRAEKVPVGDVASRFGVTPENIKAIVNRRSWRHLLDGQVCVGNKGLVDLGRRDPRQGTAA